MSISGTQDHRFSIGGVRFSILSNTEMNCLGLKRFRAFLSGSPASDVRVHYTLAEGTEAGREPQLCLKDLLPLFPGTSSSSHDPAKDCALHASPPLLQTLADCADHSSMVTLEIRGDSVVVKDYRSHRIDSFHTPGNAVSLKNARVDPTVFSVFLHDFDALLVHSSCVIFEGRAAVFLAMDDGGKTTAACLCSGGRVLSDDQVLFRKQPDGSWLAYGTPWTTFEPNTGNAAPGAFFLLEKSDRFSLQKLGPRELFSFLWDEHKAARFMLPKVYQTMLFDLYRDLSMSAPVYLMKFPRDHVDREAILKCLNP